MKRYILALFALAAFAQACATNSGSPANVNNVSNANSPSINSAAVVKNANAPAANVEKNTTTKTDKSAVSGQKPERVEFAAGKTETHLKRAVPANGSIEFVFNARSGQRMNYSANYDGGSDTDLELFLTEPGLQDISNASAANEPNEFIIKKSGDHRITVQNKTGKKVNLDFGLVIK